MYNFVISIARQFFFLLFLCFSISCFSQNYAGRIDSIAAVLPSQTGIEKFQSYYIIVAMLDQLYDEKAIPLADEGYAHFLTLKNPDEDTWTKASNFPYAQAGFALQKDDFKTAQQKCDVLMEHAGKMEALGYDAALIKCNAEFYRAIVYNNQNKNELALKYALNAVTHFQNPDTIVWAIPVFAFIGNRYGDLKKFSIADKYFEKTISYYKDIVEHGIKEKEKDGEVNRKYYRSSLARAYYNRGSMYIKHELYNKALADYENAAKYGKGVGNYMETKAAISLADVYSKLDRNQEAYQNLKLIESDIPDLKNELTRLYYYETLTNVTKNLGKYEEAFQNLKTTSALRDSFYLQKNDKELAELQTKYETKEKENEIVQLQADKAAQSNQNKLLWILVGGLSLLAGFIYFQTRLKKKFADQIIQKDKEVLELKENFFINITHQLRTPLSLIIAPLKEIQNSDIDSETKLKVDQAIKNSSRLLELFNQLLDWNKMEAHALKLSMKKAEIFESVRAIFQRYEELAHQKQITFIYESPKTPVFGELDFDKFEKVLSNLISNAIKFTPIGGKVTVRSKIQNDSLKVEVEDNGIGIKESDIDQVFEKYYQAGDGRNGFGFGLTFANELTKLMGGNLSAQSTSNVKTVFELNIPFTQLDQLPRGTKKTLINPILKESSLSLLIIEDNIELNNYLSTFFESQYTILSALNKKAALEFAYEHAPDIILCDVMLPDGNGFQILEELKNNTSTNHIPILMLTAKTEEKDRIESWDKGADGYLTKPFDPEELNAVIRNLLVNRKNVQKQFSELSEEFLADKTPEVQDPFMEKLLTLMNDNIDNEYYSIDDLASNFPINRTHFYQKVKAVSGSTPKTLFRELRLKKAHRLIISGIPPKKAALKTGFVSLSHFSRSYKSFFNENPSETLKS